MILEPLLPPEKPVGSDREVDLREVLNALMYGADNGINGGQCRMIFPAWQTVYGYLRRWSHEQMMVSVGNKSVCIWDETHNPASVMVDSQSVEMAQKGDQNTGLTAARRSKEVNATLS